MPDDLRVTTSAPIRDEPLPVEMMNTIWADRAGVHDALAEPAEIAGWLAAVGNHSELPGCELVPDAEELVVGDFREFRDALRRLATLVTNDERTIGASPVIDAVRACAVLNRAAARAPSWSQLHVDGGTNLQLSKRSAGNAADAILAGLAESSIQFFSSPDAVLLRPCYAPGCVLYFTRDHPRREWCSAECGNRARVARHYARHKTTG